MGNVAPFSMENELAALVSGFDRDPARHRAMFDRQMAVQPEKFYREAIEILKSETESRGTNYLVSLLLSHDLLVRAICDPVLDRLQAAHILSVALLIDPGLDVKLLRLLAQSVDSDSAIPRGAAGRLLDIIGDLAPINRILPSLARLFRHPDPYVRSKAVLMVGRANRSARWAVQRLSDPDTRIRASVVEGLWGAEGDDVREVLRNAAADSNNRVAGNALLGLYHMGDVATITEIQSMATNPSMLFRATAAWVMGETLSPRFLESLAAMLRDSSPMVRKRAFAAMRKVKDAVMASHPAEWQLGARVAGSDPQKGIRRLSIAVSVPNGTPPPLYGTHFLLTENGRLVHSYKFAERPVQDAMPVVFILPRGVGQCESQGLQGALRCLPLKRLADFWACEHYVTEGPCESVGSAEAPAFHSNPASAEACLRTLPQKTDCADLWHSIWRALQGESSGVRGRRHLILFNLSRSPEAPALDFASSLLARGSLQVVSLTPDPALEALCAKVNGTFEVAANQEQVPHLIEIAYLRLMARYEMTYRPWNLASTDLRLRLLHTAGTGEAVVAVPPAPRIEPGSSPSPAAP